MTKYVLCKLVFDTLIIPKILTFQLNPVDNPDLFLQRVDSLSKCLTIAVTMKITELINGCCFTGIMDYCCFGCCFTKLHLSTFV